MNNNYRIKDLSEKRILIIDDKEYETHYSTRVIELLIRRKGLERAIEYFKFKETRGKYYLDTLFKYFSSHNIKNLKVLEVGCSFGHITEYLNEQPCISEIYTYDVDKDFVEITKAQVEDLNLYKVKEVQHFTNQESRDLKYRDGYFDLIIVMGIVEHLPFENRYLYIDNYYKKLKLGGLIGFFDIPNRYFPIELHSTKLPFIHWLPPEIAFIYAKLFRKTKFKNVEFSQFTRPGTAWRNSSYYELLPKTIMIDIKDISEEIGYGYVFFNKKMRGKFKKLIKVCFSILVRFITMMVNVPPSFFLPTLNVVFKKVRDYETV